SAAARTKSTWALIYGSSLPSGLGTSNRALNSTTLLTTSGVGSTWRRTPSRRTSGWPRAVNHTGMPTSSWVISASETWVRTVVVLRSAICTMIGAVWLAFRVWTWLASWSTTVPLIGAWIRV